MTLISLEPERLASVIPIPEEILQEIPLTQSHYSFVQSSRDTIEAILNGWDSRLLLIVGPCSIHDPVSALDYGKKLSDLAHSVSDRFFVVMRTYFEKARSIIGWKGFLYDPGIDGSHQMAKGIRLSRKLLADLADLRLPSGAEILEINTSQYYTDLLSWGCVGARTSSSPPHRQIASGLNFPIGFKNSTDGNIDNAIHGIVSAESSHAYIGLSPSGQMVRIQTEGNPHCHLVLRGSLQGPNYNSQFVKLAIQKCQKAQISNKIVIDCSHDNCGKNPEQQEYVFCSVIEQILEGNNNIVGLMLESHLHSGSQDLAFPLQYGVSITDPCMDWQKTERIILQAYSRFK